MLLGAYGRNRDRVDGAMLALAAREVMGEEPAMAGRGGKRAAIGVAALLLLATVLWYGRELWYHPALPVAQTVPEPQLIEGPVVPALLPVEALATAEDTVMASADIQPPTSSELVAANRMGRWNSSGHCPLQCLCQLSFAVIPPVLSGVACVKGYAQTWEELHGYGRPVVLRMITPGALWRQCIAAGNNGHTRPCGHS